METTEYGNYKPHEKYMKKGYSTADEIDASNAEFDALIAEKKIGETKFLTRLLPNAGSN